MTRTALRLATFTIAACVAFSPVLARADGGGGGPPEPPASPPTDQGKGKSKGQKKTERQFIDGYKLAYAAIYQRHDYAGGIAALRALGHDNHPDVANLVGYANRKLGNYEESKRWYEAALKSDPSHVRTWQYYGLWQLEQNRPAQAQVHLDRIAAICGTSCREYRLLAEAMGVVAAGGRPVY